MQNLQLKNQLIQAQIQETIANAQKILGAGNVDMAKARNLEADTNLKSLDFVEQESGVKQERDLQKQGAQARAQAQMKVLEHQLGKNQPKQ